MDIVLTKALKYCLNLYWNILIIVWIRRVSLQLYEVYQKVIVGDYDPFNLMRMFGIKKVKTGRICYTGYARKTG